MNLDRSLAIVTGGASGLGRATASALAAGGADVVILDRNEDHGERAASDLGARFVAADVTDETSVRRALEEAIAEAPPLRVVVNCAGGGPPPRPMLDDDLTPHDLRSWERTLDLNVTGTFNVTRLAAAHMASQDALDTGLRGVIVTVSSVAAFQGPPDLVAYATAKSALVGFTRAASHSYARWGIRVVGIAPGTFRTPAVETFAARDASILTPDTTAPVRLGEPAEFGSLVVHIAANDYLNGHVIRLDAGSPGGW